MLIILERDVLLQYTFLLKLTVSKYKTVNFNPNPESSYIACSCYSLHEHLMTLLIIDKDVNYWRFRRMTSQRCKIVAISVTWLYQCRLRGIGV